MEADAFDAFTVEVDADFQIVSTAWVATSTHDVGALRIFAISRIPIVVHQDFSMTLAVVHCWTS